MPYGIEDGRSQAIRDEFSRLLQELDALSLEIKRQGGKRPQFGIKYPELTNLILDICPGFSPPTIKNIRL